MEFKSDDWGLAFACWCKKQRTIIEFRNSDEIKPPEGLAIGLAQFPDSATVVRAADFLSFLPLFYAQNRDAPLVFDPTPWLPWEWPGEVDPHVLSLERWTKEAAAIEASCKRALTWWSQQVSAAESSEWMGPFAPQRWEKIFDTSSKTLNRWDDDGTLKIDRITTKKWRIRKVDVEKLAPKRT